MEFEAVVLYSSSWAEMPTHLSLPNMATNKFLGHTYLSLLGGATNKLPSTHIGPVSLMMQGLFRGVLDDGGPLLLYLGRVLLQI